MKTLFFLLLFLPIVNSCTTTKNTLVSVAPDEDIYFVVERISNLCLSSTSPQFLTEFSALNSGDNFQLEGIWKDNFTKLSMQVLGVFGEQYAYMEITDHKMNVFSSRKNILDRADIKNLLGFISTVGSKGLRGLFCGSYAFSQDKAQKNIFIQSNNSLKINDYLAKNDIEIDGHSVAVQSDLTLKDSVDDDGYDLFMKSHFKYGFLNSNTNLEVQWAGYVDDDEATPKIIEFNYEKEKYELKLLDYN